MEAKLIYYAYITVRMSKNTLINLLQFIELIFDFFIYFKIIYIFKGLKNIYFRKINNFKANIVI